MDTRARGSRHGFDVGGAALSALGVVLLVVGILLTGTYGWGITVSGTTPAGMLELAPGSLSPVWPLVVLGFVFLGLFVRHLSVVERSGGTPLLSPRILRNRVSNLGLITQQTQWLILQGLAFVVSVFVQTVRGLGPIETGLVLTPATIGILAASLAAPRMAGRRPQALLVQAGFVATIVGIVLLVLFASPTSSFATFIPGLLLTGLGIGVMLTASVNIVQSSFPEADQGEISGLSRAVSNLGSSLGVAIAGSIVVSSAFTGSEGYGYALIVLGGFAVIGLVAALLLPRRTPSAAAT